MKLLPPAATRFWPCALVLIGLMGAVQVITIRDETATWDEPGYLAAGYSYWTTGRFDMIPEHPPLTRLLCALPLYLFYNLRLDTNSPEWKRSEFVMVGNLFLYRNNADPDALLFAGRLVTIGITLLFAGYLAWWTRRRFGDGAGLFAVMLLAFDPNLIAHGRYATNDVAVSAFIFLTCTLWIEYLLERRWLWTALTGLSLGLALSSKYSALYLGPVLMVMTAVWAWRNRTVRVFGALATAGPIAIAVIAAVYWPEVLRTSRLPPLGEKITRAGVTGPALSALATLQVPAYTFLTGIDWQANHNAMGHPAYLLGKVSARGWWYYFPVVFAVKTPAAVLAGAAAALLFIWRSKRRMLLATVLFPAAAYLALAMTSHIDIGVRHLLPAYPFLYVAIAALLLERKKLWPVALAVVILLAVESASIYPDYLAFFNWPSGGPDAGPGYLLDSNLDWGQDYKKLGRYLKRQGIDGIRLGFFANVDFPHYGIHPDGIPEGANADNLDCVLAMSATPLFGQYVGPERYAWLRARKPMVIIGHSIYVYDLRKARK